MGSEREKGHGSKRTLKTKWGLNKAMANTPKMEKGLHRLMNQKGNCTQKSKGTEMVEKPKKQLLAHNIEGIKESKGQKV